MPTKDIVYFDRPGPENTDAVVEAVAKRREELRIEHVVTASSSGRLCRAQGRCSSLSRSTPATRVATPRR